MHSCRQPPLLTSHGFASAHIASSSSALFPQSSWLPSQTFLWSIHWPLPQSNCIVFSHVDDTTGQSYCLRSVLDMTGQSEICTYNDRALQNLARSELRTNCGGCRMLVVMLGQKCMWRYCYNLHTTTYACCSDVSVSGTLVFRMQFSPRKVDLNVSSFSLQNTKLI